jgi:protein ImuB
VLVEPGGSPGFCAPLSIGWLQTLGESTPETIELFHRLGLRRLGDLAALDATDVMGRFGPPGAHVHRLASGLDGRPPSTVDPAPDRTRSVRLDEPLVQLESLVFVAKRLADDLVGSLSTEGRVCTRLVVELETEHGERSERSWYRSGGLSAAAMVERVRWQLDAWINLPRGSEHEITGGVVVVRLVPDEVTADDGVQQGLWGGQSDADRRATRAIARLSTIVADEVVTVPVWCGGRLPQERFRWVPASTTDLAARHRMRDVTWPGELPSPSPATVLTDPIPIELLGEDGRSMQVSGRGAVSSRPAALRVSRGDEASGWVLGAPQQIRAWAGPWPIEERWWDPTRARRQARFQVMIDDGTAYLVVVEDRRWWITAIYD